MRITKLNGNKRIITFGPHREGEYLNTTRVYEKSNARLTVDTFAKDGCTTHQVKTYSKEGRPIKEIVVNFVKGIRKNIERIL